MERPTLIIANKRYSSWSMRPWLALRAGGIAFDETLVRIDVPEERATYASLSPTAKVPCLVLSGERIAESIAICEWAAEVSPAPLWPIDRLERALARSVSAEMHAGFASMRRELSMDVQLRTKKDVGADARADIERVRTIWRDLRSRFSARGDYLFGAWSIADCMFAPVATRFVSYGIDLGDGADAKYCEAVLAHAAVREWVEAGEREP
jgi:glutathione S-transferase